MTTEQPSLATSQPRRSSRRLRVLLSLNVLALLFFSFTHLDRPTVESFGSLAEDVYDLFNLRTRTKLRRSAAAQRFIEDVEALGGEARVVPTKLGVSAGSEWFEARFRGGTFDDDAFAHLVELQGVWIEGLSLQDTGVTAAGLVHLRHLALLQRLEISNSAGRVDSDGPAPMITDAGLRHLNGLARLMSLDLSGQPVTDAGIATIEDLPSLSTLTLRRTRVSGAGLARFRLLSLLSSLNLDGCQVDEDQITALLRASTLHGLSLRGVPLTKRAVSDFKSIPSLEHLDVSGCGLLDEDLDDLIECKPDLTVLRQ